MRRLQEIMSEKTINLSILDFKLLESDEIIVTINSINLSILDFKYEFLDDLAIEYEL